MGPHKTRCSSVNLGTADAQQTLLHIIGYYGICVVVGI